MESTAACRCSCAGLPRHSRTSSGLQELKTPDEKFPRAALEKAGYGAIWHGQKSWNGVAILEGVLIRRNPAEVDREVRGWEKASDHAPVWIELGENSRPTSRRRVNSAKPAR